MRPKHDHHYLHFTKKERKGIILLLCIILLFIIFPFLYPLVFNEKATVGNRYINEIAKLKAQETDSSRKKYVTFKKFPSVYSASYKEYKTFSNGEVFDFDPNTISPDEWKRLGLKDKTITTIQNYVSKGGKFREPADIKKIWGLSGVLAEKLLPFVKIKHKDIIKDEGISGFKNNYPAKKTFQPIDVNDADSNIFARLPGIGVKLSLRIIKYREKLGGFYSANQVAETFGLPDSTYQKIKPSLQIGQKKIKQININTSTIDELKSHPYIRYQLANVMIQYRLQHGNYRLVEDIKHIMLINDSTYIKLAPYLSVE